jgi:pilus assembly protein CpaD
MNAHPSPAAGRCVGLALRTLVLGTAAVVLAGCYTAQQVMLDEIPNDYRQRHPIVLREAPHSVEILIGNRRGTLTAAQRAEVLAFAHTWHGESTGGILIDVPTGTPNAASAATAAREVRAILGSAGVPDGAVGIRPKTPSDPRKLATVRLHYPKVAAEAGPCGLWPYDLGPTYHREHYENRSYYNLGCANQRNLAAMVDNPTDLVQPRAEIPTYTGRRTTVLDKHHRGEPSATVYPDAQKGRISTIGQ